MKSKHVLNVILTSSVLLAMTSLLCSCGDDSDDGKTARAGKSNKPVAVAPEPTREPTKISHLTVFPDHGSGRTIFNV